MFRPFNHRVPIIRILVNTYHDIYNMVQVSSSSQSTWKNFRLPMSIVQYYLKSRNSYIYIFGIYSSYGIPIEP